MNISEIKTVLGEKPKHLGQDNSVQNQLRDAGLRQAVSGQETQASILTSQLSSKTSVAVHVYNNSLNSHLSINQLKANLPAPKAEEQAESTNKGLFDFEEIAKNVLNFIGGALRNAQGKGADQETLSNLFDQATTGVLKGIKMAKEDLAGVMNDEIQNGISRSQELIEQGIEKLKEEIFGTILDPQVDALSTQELTQSVDYAKSESGELLVVTKDGDRVKIVFENLEQFEFNQRKREGQIQPITPDPTSLPSTGSAEAGNVLSGIQPVPAETGRGQPGIQPVPVETGRGHPGIQPVPVETGRGHPGIQPVPVETGRGHPGIQPVPIETDNGQPGIQPVPIETTDSPGFNVGSKITKDNYQYVQGSTLSFSVRGELDEDELRAIGSLVANANKLADEFFNGDIEKAYNQALTLGFNDQELTGFALQLNRQEKVQVIQTYESVSHFKDDSINEDAAKAAKPVAHYLDKMLDLVEESKQKLQEGNSFDNLLNDLINQMGEVHTPDLIQALNRFHTFNQKLMDNLPSGFQQEA